MKWELGALKLLAKNPTVPGVALADTIGEIEKLNLLLVKAYEQIYLPLKCPGCGRLRLEYSPMTKELRCEKCGQDAETLNELIESQRDAK